MFLVRIGLGGREYLGVLDTGASISIVAKNILPCGSLKNTMTTAAIRMGDGHVVHSCGDCEVEVPMGSRTIAHRFYAMDTEAFDFVLGTDFFVQHSQIQSLTLQTPYLLYVDHGNGRGDLPSQFQNSQFLRVHPVFEAMASGNSELFTRDPIQDKPVDKIVLDCWSFAAFALHSIEAMGKQQTLQDYVREHQAAAPLLREDALQNPGPKDLLWSSISRDWDLLDGDTKKDIRDKLKRPTWKMEDQGQPPTWPAFKRAWDDFAGYWVPRVPDSKMVYTLLSALPDQKKKLYGALHTYLKWDYTHI